MRELNLENRVMRKLKLSVAALACLLSVLVFPALAPAQSARMSRVKYTHDVVRGGQSGMLITLDAEIDGLRGVKVVAAAFFSFPNGKALFAAPGSAYRS